jgi:3'-phosphoadenosine 5'-phosphosulfate sulfotransferase (PAPS reductase)/FAD synthetase
MKAEPILTAEDASRWRTFERAALAWATGRTHAYRVDAARRAIGNMASRSPAAYVAWSAGKDSTALAHLAASEGARAAMSVKDDLDFPGEEAYVLKYAAEWGISLDIARPPGSLQVWLAEHAPRANDDLHGRASAFSRWAFYDVVAAYRDAHGVPGVYLGMRAEESAGRRLNRMSRGLLYEKADGEVVCTPIADWRGIDVYAYLLSRGIELLPVYRCIRLHERPDLVRKSWWLPGTHSARGGMVWLRTYYPSLYARLCELLPDARVWA